MFPCSQDLFSFVFKSTPVYTRVCFPSILSWPMFTARFTVKITDYSKRPARVFMEVEAKG